MKIYTKTGDDGTTGLFGGDRLPKSSARIEAYGTVDELNSALGVARAGLQATDNAGLASIDLQLERIQNELFHLGAELATAPAKLGELPPASRLAEGAERWMEDAIDRACEELGPIRAFILPGGTAPAAQLHVARTLCRRAERVVVALAAAEPVPATHLLYLNRLSDLLFTLARLANHRAGLEETKWAMR
ncbi:MAG: cob(I)yrinic acid a,c-diamide adenosyltransferase [Candidatus Wallbacteria bacterium]|nr:cob(I)yrinic acid a,c-diamide adenosyltransferase [Candidatus Wallbacteria bacterium]